MQTQRSSHWYAGTDRNPISRAWIGAACPVMPSTVVRTSRSRTQPRTQPCNAHLKRVAESVKHGVYEAGASR